MWKISEDELIFHKMQGVIANALKLQKNIASFKNGETYKVNIIIAVGDVTFSVIGDDKARHFVIFGTAIEELKHGKKISSPHDLLISLSAWQHCTPSQYDYVIKDAYNVKVLRIKEKIDITLPDIPESVTVRFSLPGGPTTKIIEHEHEEEKEEEEEEDDEEEEVPTAITRIIAVDSYFDLHLRSYSIKPVLHQIEKGKPLKFLAELRRLTVVSVDIIPKRLSINELIHLVDKCFLLLLSIVTQYAGCINMANLYERNIFFCIVFGLREYYDEIEFKHGDSCKNGITCAMQILQKMRDIDDIRATFIGVSTGMAYCGVIGHARKTYAIVGPPINKAVHIMDISYNKVSCDYNTVMNSRLSKDKFRSRGIRTLGKKEKCHVYEYMGDTL
ncbi:adenylate cyclase type 10-like [Pseudomyrmex gracilis]|uniref:adenylate cyclase type 10-like n=1 Tax=Pseudomyrmex gracilis TaxID=219809 RepID=UPI000994E65B|nr:adenylate cyclase type 10-like [Pseudomyrmex gracilis]